MTTALLEKRLNPFRERIENKLLSFLLQRFPARPLPNADTHKRYLKAMEILMEALESEDLAAADRQAAESFLAIISPLIQDYEKKAFPSKGASALDVLRFLMTQHDLKQEDLAADLGGQSVVSEILHGKRKLNVDQIARLSKRFHISPASFFPASR